MRIDIRLSDSNTSNILLVLESFFLFCRYINYNNYYLKDNDYINNKDNKELQFVK